MRRVQAVEGEIFRPRGQAARDLELARRCAGEVIRILGPRLSEERRRRIDEAVSHRTRTPSLAVEGVHDPHNTAAIIRTCDAFGIQDVHIVEGATRFRSSRKVTQGAHKWVDVSVWRSPRELAAAAERRGARLLVADMEGAIGVDDLPRGTPTILVFGNEAEGISDGMRALADGAFRVPLYGLVESLHVSVAAAIAISRLRTGGQGDLPADESAILLARFYLRAVRAGHDIVVRELQAGPA